MVSKSKKKIIIAKKKLQGNVNPPKNLQLMQGDVVSHERTGVPCSHILKITDHIEESMIKVQHLKVFHVHYGQPDSDMSQQLMKAVSLQIIDEDKGVPVSDLCLEKALHPNESR